jgi:NTP pyrophosphatase (non-canonical NTP hydrolase)
MALTKSPTSAYVERFAELMERKLSENWPKGDRPGWLAEDATTLLNRLEEEVDEMFLAVWRHAPAEEIVRECADVANCALFIAEKYGGLGA